MAGTGRHRGRDSEARVAALAGRQHGVVTRAQLLDAGLSPGMVRGRLETGRLVPLHRGVYLASVVAPPRATEMAAVLACSGRAFVSHRYAVWMWELGPRPSPGSPVDVRVGEDTRVRRPGIRAHRTTHLEPIDIAVMDGIPLTSTARSLVDLAAIARPRELERAVARADRRELVTRDEMVGFVARHRGEPGMAILAAILGQDAGPVFTRSVFEDRFRDEVRRFGLPQPEFNVTFRGFELDTLWHDEGLAVELDGAAYHRSWSSQVSDRSRDGHLAAAGITVIRVAWRQLTKETEPTMVKIAQALAVRRDRLARR
jgi:hypothetical protein